MHPIPFFSKILMLSPLFLSFTHQEFPHSSPNFLTRHRKTLKSANKHICKRAVLLSFWYLWPVPGRSNCRQAIPAKPWDEAYLIQINYLKNVRGTKFTCAPDLRLNIFQDQVRAEFRHIIRGFRSYTLHTPANLLLKCELSIV